MVELDADDALASTAHLAAAEKPVQRVIIWTPDKDLARCVRGNLVVQADRRSKATCDAAGIRSKFGVEPGVIEAFSPAVLGDSRYMALLFKDLETLRTCRRARWARRGTALERTLH